MSDPRQITIQEYHYDLPADRIATHPLPERDQSKLLIYKNGAISESIYKQLANELQGGSMLVFNDTRVVEARLLFQKDTGSTIEIFCLEPADSMDITHGMSSQGVVRWKCMVGGAAKWKQPVLEKRIIKDEEEVILFARIAERFGEIFIIEFSWSPANLHFGEVLHLAGVIPLPPYLHRKAEASDYERYQTVYAKEEGSVAAPTAGLHFTPALLESLEAKGVNTSFVTLHVGAGTFLPVKSETIGEHEMHKEWISVKLSFIAQLKESLKRDVIMVGTTSLRTTETLYWMGVKAFQNPELTIEQLEVTQWDPYELATKAVSGEEALSALAKWMSDRKKDELICRTQLLIAPGYNVKLANAIITNFHQPESTLLLLIAAMIGEDWKKVYEYALQHDFRFLSYGDGSLLWKK
jgi:S-adenosylmethionine:tRNA ribosyltransferase-isomerase